MLADLSVYFREGWWTPKTELIHLIDWTPSELIKPRSPRSIRRGLINFYWFLRGTRHDFPSKRWSWWDFHLRNIFYFSTCSSGRRLSPIILFLQKLSTKFFLGGLWLMWENRFNVQVIYLIIIIFKSSRERGESWRRKEVIYNFTK